MDLVGEIVEKDVGEPTLPSVPETVDIKKIQDLKAKRQSAFAARRKNRDAPKRAARPVDNTPNETLSEAEKIHKENMEKISSMSPEEIEAESQELMSQLNPKLIESLKKRAEQREQKDHKSHQQHHDHQHAEGYSEWIGGMKTEDGIKELSHLDKDDIDKALGISKLSIDDELTPVPEKQKKSEKKVRFDTMSTVRYEDLPEGTEIEESGWEDVEDINDLMEDAPEEYNLVNDTQEEIHFPKPKSDTPEYGEDLDLNDPNFYDKLHEKYYPDLPKETSKLAWMTQPVPKQVSSTYESISDMRFDFQGNLIELDKTTSDVPTHLGLHHHSDNPHLPGYTLGELVHLSRSVVAGQRCLSVQMLGRILHKLGLHKYNIIPVSDDDNDKEFNENAQQITKEFEKMMWDLIEELRVIDSISEAADEKRTSNLSIRNYAIEALWLWKQGGGREDTIDDELEKIM